MELITKDLILRPLMPEQIAAFAEGRSALASLLNAAVPDDWPGGETESILPWVRSRLAEESDLAGWLVWLVLHRADRTLIGDAGFVGRPDAEGAVTLGYEMAPDYRRRGYGLQAARALVGWAFRQPGVQAVRAETFPGGQASIRLLRRLGMRQRPEADRQEPDMLHWELLRTQWETAVGPCPIRLTPLSALDWASYRAEAVRNYAAEKVRAGNWAAEDALAHADADFTQLLPLGIDTPGHLLYAIEEAASHTQVGVLWVSGVRQGSGPAMAFVYDFVIYADYRRRGYGEAALHALESVVRGMGLETIGLHVFGHNHAARKLYEKLGYQVTNLNMAKRIADAEEPA
ncbi:MAG: GNAT family N-acetyltransferase [Anaerolineae bacterium]